MLHGIHKFQDVWAWFIVKNGQLIDQGHSENEEQARNEYQTALGFWSTHDYETD